MHLQHIKTFLTIKSILVINAYKLTLNKNFLIRINTFTKYKNSFIGINTHKYT